MSRSIDLFIDCDRPIEEVAAEVTRLTGLALAPGELPGTWTMEEGDVHAALRAHPYVDDGDLAFESYRYALSSRVGNDARPVDSPEATMLRLIGEALHKGGLPALLVFDLQYRDRPGPSRPSGRAEVAGDDTADALAGGGAGARTGGAEDRTAGDAERLA